MCGAGPRNHFFLGGEGPDVGGCRFEPKDFETRNLNLNNIQINK